MGKVYYTVPLAADDTVIYPEVSDKFKADISFIGTYLPQKRRIFKEQVFPLRNKYNLKLYGQDWTTLSRLVGWIQKIGQYFNIPFLRALQKASLNICDERKVYCSSSISINIHEDYQRRLGGDCNERTFKVPLAGGFEITDDVACIRKYFEVGKEIVVAENIANWFDKIDYYYRNLDERLDIIDAGRKRVLSQHTYKHRVQQLIDIYNASSIR